MMTAFIITIIAFFGVAIINFFTYVGVDLTTIFPILNAAICFFINMFYVSDGGTGMHQGQFAIINKGTFVRFITEEMYQKFQLIEIRVVTSMFMLMGLIAIVGYYHTNFVADDSERSDI